LAQMRSADRVQKCLLFGVDRTYGGHHETDAIDPKRTFGISQTGIVLKVNTGQA
jgi:hypothetical protein